MPGSTRGVRHRKQQCKFCRHQIGIGQIKIHEAACEKLTPELRERRWRTVENQRKNRIRKYGSNGSVPPRAVAQRMERSVDLTEVLELAQLIAALPADDREAIRALIS